MKFSEYRKDLVDYYGARAEYYDMTYEIPAIQGDLAEIRERLQSILSGRKILELACGTGYWTQCIAETAESVLATDPAPETLKVAREKEYAGSKVAFEKADAFHLGALPAEFDGGFHFRLISHLPRSRVKSFLSSFHSRLVEGAKVAFGDDMGSGIQPLDDSGNMGHMRKVRDGRSFPIIKNRIPEIRLREVLEETATKVRYFSNQYFWLIEYEYRPQ